ncbi:hypothetical protein FOL47_005103 [Perkinsus chesapeaki]|uniref:Uncharacterized protein n=1 Tax=Perkinsus chesapeaki TaxID=330153 RepID=A0A7J6LYX6_PERCH|nr:hypothetical protein FOL47_005103 [Perkinsus chesapeaki]
MISSLGQPGDGLEGRRCVPTREGITNEQHIVAFAAEDLPKPKPSEQVQVAFASWEMPHLKYQFENPGTDRSTRLNILVHLDQRLSDPIAANEAIECGVLDMLVAFLDDIDQSRVTPDGDVDTHYRLLALKVVYRLSRSTVGRAALAHNGNALQALKREETLLSPRCWLTRRTTTLVLLELSGFAEGAARLFDTGYLEVLYSRVCVRRSSQGPVEGRSEVRCDVFEVLSNMVSLGPSDAGKVAASFAGLPMLIPASPTNSTVSSILRFLLEVSLVGVDAKKAVSADSSFTNKIVLLFMSVDAPPSVVDVGWSLAASLTVLVDVKTEVWDACPDLLDHVIERLTVNRPSQGAVLRHVIQVLANLQELPTIREWFLSHGAAEVLDAIAEEDGQDATVIQAEN